MSSPEFTDAAAYGARMDELLAQRDADAAAYGARMDERQAQLDADAATRKKILLTNTEWPEIYEDHLK